MKITPTNLFTLSVDEIIKSVSAVVLQDVPEGIDSEDDFKRIERMLGKFANNYAYVIELLSYSRNYVRILKRNKQKDEYEDMMDKRDALESISSALKLQYQAVSRMLTVRIEAGDENNLHEIRKER